MTVMKTTDMDVSRLRQEVGDKLLEERKQAAGEAGEDAGDDKERIPREEYVVAQKGRPYVLFANGHGGIAERGLQEQPAGQD